MKTLSNLEIMSYAPSAFAQEPASRVSDAYEFVSTEKVIHILRRHDWAVVSAREQRSGRARKIGYQQHMLRFRRVRESRPLVGDTWPEIVLVNSHDGRCAFHLHAGLFRLACGNGLVVADATFEQIRVRHVGFDESALMQNIFAMSSKMPHIADAVVSMQTRTLSPLEREDFAREAIALRWQKDAPISPSQALEIRRDRDRESSLWVVFNVVQENLIRGCSGASRGVRSIDGNLSLNGRLWDLSVRYAA